VLQFRILGPLEVTERDAPLYLGGAKQRAVLAILLLHRGQVISSERLINELWGERPPATAAKTLQGYVFHLRRALGDGLVHTRRGGYELELTPGQLDADEFERLAVEGREALTGGDPAAAAGLLRDALRLCRGPPLADFTYESFAQAEIASLEEARLAALEVRIDADLALGREDQLVGELNALVREHPLRERIRAQLMLALYRSGRQAEALHAYRLARSELSEGLGLEPGGELKRLERAILEQDPALDLSPEKPRVARRVPAPDRSLLIFPGALAGLEGLLRLAAPLAASDPPRELIVACVVGAAEVGAATAALADRADELRAGGVAVRTAAFSSPTPGDDVVRLAARQDVELLLMDAGRSPLEGEAGAVLEQAPCDVALLVEAGGSLGAGPVVVPFGAARHDWAALELGAWVARATGAPLRLIGAASDQQTDGRDASRLLADASLIVQHRAGVVAEPLLASPGRKGVIALAAGAGLLVVGLSDRWREEGLGRIRTQLAAAPPAPTVLVRRRAAPGGLAPDDTQTRFTWSLTASGR
jgi:DNA-binding SARP family transcriptional activator